MDIIFRIIRFVFNVIIIQVFLMAVAQGTGFILLMEFYLGNFGIMSLIGLVVIVILLREVAVLEVLVFHVIIIQVFFLEVAQGTGFILSMEFFLGNFGIMSF